MSESLEIVDVKETLLSKDLCHTFVVNHKRILKSNENILKPKCNRELKKKLKKYKLRRDGIEDPDILDVSKILVTSLTIKSPNSVDKVCCNNNIPEKEELHPRNYLTKMVKKKKTCIDMKSMNESNQNEDVCPLSILGDKVNKEHMDAFKVMMEARNKSIGSNSPGKEKIEEIDSKEILERKETKAKRVLSLQKMALSKGSQKNKEIEEFREKCIQKKMLKRAERFKDMIVRTDCKGEKSIDQNQIQPSNDISHSITMSEKKKSLMLCDIFSDTAEVIDHGKQCKKVSKEDIDFLNKLSPSIKKKENMLSYFKKVPKDDCELLDESLDNNKTVIKVKFKPKRKKKIEMLHSSEDMATDNIEEKVVKINGSNESNVNNHKRSKRKRNLNIVICDESQPFYNNQIETQRSEIESNSEDRPKRNVKKPIKYIDDVQLFSSDEELHIFTPKKKKKNEKDNDENSKNNLEPKKADLELAKNNGHSNRIKFSKKAAFNNKKTKSNLLLNSLKPNNETKMVKLAPIFVTKMQLSPADIEAKEKFLKSGVPEKLKKKPKQPAKAMLFDIFPTVVHVQQNILDVSLHQEKDWYNISNIEEVTGIQNKHYFKSLLKLGEDYTYNVPVINRTKPEKILKSIKGHYPKFPVYRTYHLLRGKSKGEFKDCSYPDLDNSIEIINGHCADINYENPDQLNWCDKYKPISSKQIIGNFESIKELKKWLESWSETLFKAKQIASDSSDFSDFYHSDTDSRDRLKNTNNVLILTGQTGSGKTSSVYAVASELAIKVIEVNASSKRTGKIMLQDLQEATQSHKVDRGKNGSESSQKSQEETILTNPKKRGKPKKTYGKQSTAANQKNALKSSKTGSQESMKTSVTETLASQETVKTGMSLILIDDADIVFEQDDGFCSAISQLIQSSKRPVILITSSLSCPHLQRFLQNGKILHMHPVLTGMLGTWLDIMCLADVGNCYTGLGARMLELYGGDVRKTINCMQFYMNSNKHNNQVDEVALSQIKNNIDDEESNMSWVDSECADMHVSNNTEGDYYIDKQLQMIYSGSLLNAFNFWWSLPSLYKDYDNTKSRNITENREMEEASIDLSKIAHVIDTISAIDYFDHKNPDRGINVTTRPWHGSENASLLENENFECYYKSSLVTKEISDELIKIGTAAAQKAFKQENSLCYLTPTTSNQRYRDKLVSRHNKLSSYLNPSAVLDHRAIALDYWSTCRTICRIEKSKTDSKMKRNNRFCHYLKSLNILCKNNFFDSLTDSLS